MSQIKRLYCVARQIVLKHVEWLFLLHFQTFFFSGGRGGIDLYSLSHDPFVLFNIDLRSLFAFLSCGRLGSKHQLTN